MPPFVGPDTMLTDETLSGLLPGISFAKTSRFPVPSSKRSVTAISGDMVTLTVTVAMLHCRGVSLSQT